MEKNSSGKASIITPGGLIVFSVLALALVSAGAFTLSQNGTNKNVPEKSYQEMKQQGDNTVMTSALAPGTLVYGAWTQHGSVIKSIDLSNGAYQTLATLPAEVKKVSVLSPDRLLFIDQTDKKDHGKRLALYSITEQKNTATIPASDGFGIDDYVISPNRSYAAVWEVRFAPESGILHQGQSRVYTVDLANPSVKNLIYDEYAITPVHYPIAITDTGRVFMDTFMPNDVNGGAGWAYGISIAEFNGTQKQALNQMKNGTYGTQPVLSRDGSKLAFAGYDGAFGPGEKVKNGYRQSLLTPNTVELLDVSTLKREKLPNFPNSKTYSAVSWDKVNDDLILGIIGKDADNSGLYIYNIVSNTLIKSNAEITFITALSAEKILTGSIDTSPSALGNLGNGYESPYKQFIVKESNTSKENILPLPDSIMQYIGLEPSNFFTGANSAFAVNENTRQIEFINLFSSQNSQKNNLQLYTFLMKPDLAPVRTNQQSEPLEPSLPESGLPRSESQTNNTKPKCGDLLTSQGIERGSREYANALETVSSRTSNKCFDSPLYLYGNEGQKVKVTINTYAYNAHPYYNGSYDITLLKEGMMRANGVVTESIKYDYTPAIKRITPPQYGTVASINEIGKTLKHYAQKLGLNKKETEDLISYGKQKITKPYVFVSYFNHNTSKEILPLSFSPEPNSYLNIVFYLKGYDDKPAFIPMEPVFPPPLIRNGFTAVEISALAE
jgi:hypothetical protein